MSETTDIVFLTTARTTTVQPTNGLRWNAATLEQMWLILEYECGKVVDRREEWREVPNVESRP